MDFQNIKLIALFLEGVLSFFSPCVIPIIPIYLSMLAGKKELDKEGNIVYNRATIIINSLFFTTGIAVTFFLISFATSMLSTFFNSNISILQTISAILIIFMGLLQLGIFNNNFLKREFSFKNKIKTKKINPFIAFAMGFTFSFSWTPCIGPILASVFLYASTHTGILSYLLVIVYSIGFILPFLIVALFATSLLNVIKKRPKIMNYAVIISGIILVIIGVSILTGHFQTIMVRYFIS